MKRALDNFKTLGLDEINQVTLLERNETKYWFHKSDLETILDRIIDSYKLLTVNNEVVQRYKTNYFDTQNSEMYMQHHNQKLHRYKIRKRLYIGSNISFLEIKNKSNKGRTLKKRISSDINEINFLDNESHFIAENSPFVPKDLNPVLVNTFKRLTLVGNNFKERCTIDFDLEFICKDKVQKLENIVVLEVKTDGRKQPSILKALMLEKRIKSSAFSKYCIGRCLISKSLKQNRFKILLNDINKINSLKN